MEDLHSTLHGVLVAAKPQREVQEDGDLSDVKQAEESVAGLPLGPRDTTLAINSNDAIPKRDVNQEYFVEEHDCRVRRRTISLLCITSLLCSLKYCQLALVALI